MWSNKIRFYTNQKLELGNIVHDRSTREETIKDVDSQVTNKYFLTKRYFFSNGTTLDIGGNVAGDRTIATSFIEINPSQFPSWDKCVSFLKDVFLDIDLSRATVLILNVYAVDILPISFFREYLYINPKKGNVMILEGDNVLTIGLSPIKINLYGDRKLDDCPFDAFSTGFEIQFRCQACPITKFDEIPQLSKLKIFRNMRYYGQLVGFDLDQRFQERLERFIIGKRMVVDVHQGHHLQTEQLINI